MLNANYFGMAVALACGLIIGLQTTFLTLAGRYVGPARASLVVNVAGGLLAGIIVLAAIAVQGREQWHIPRHALAVAVPAVILGFLTVMGVAFSFQRMGVAAGAATIFLGQMVTSVFIDLLGQAGGKAIPLDLRRIAGLAVLAVAVALLSPRP